MEKAPPSEALVWVPDEGVAPATAATSDGIDDASVPRYVRRQLMARVYVLLSVQLMATGGIVVAVRHWPMLQDPQAAVLGMFLSFGPLCMLTCARPAFPCNLVCLALITLGLGIAVAEAALYASAPVVCQAVLGTSVVFGTLSAAVLCTRCDVTWLQQWLLAGLLLMVTVGVVGVLWPPSEVTAWHHAIFGWGGVLLFSGYILYDTSLLVHRFGPDDAIDACLCLYLDLVNLFLSLLQLLQSPGQ